MRRWLIALLLTLIPVTAFAQSQVPSLRDVMELTRAGLPDDVILALIEVNRSVYPTDPETLKSLKAAGVSPAVIVALVKSGRQRLVEPSAQVGAEPPIASAEPGAIVLEREAPEPRIREVAVPVPVYVAVPTYRSYGRSHRPQKPVEPVYWGWGGKLRPDAWKTSADVQKDARIPEAQRK